MPFKPLHGIFVLTITDSTSHTKVKGCQHLGVEFFGSLVRTLALSLIFCFALFVLLRPAAEDTLSVQSVVGALHLDIFASVEVFFRVFVLWFHQKLQLFL